MQATRCKKCGRTLRDRVSIARGMGPECAGSTRGRKKYCSRRKVHSGSVYSLGTEGTAFPTLFTLVQKEPDVLSTSDSPAFASGTRFQEAECPFN